MGLLLMAGETPNPEILPPEPKELIPFRPTTTQKRIIVAVSAPAMVGFILWSFNEFTSLRGVIHMLASRLILVGMWFAGVIFLMIVVWGFQLVYKRTFVVSLSLVWALAMVALDWWAPRPLMAEPCKIIVTPSSRDNCSRAFACDVVALREHRRVQADISGFIP
jgi:hypothetical protein